MKPNATIAQTITILAMVMSLCWFVIAIANQWAAHALPSSINVLAFSLGGMSVVGAVAGFIVSALANVAFRPDLQHCVCRLQLLHGWHFAAPRQLGCCTLRLTAVVCSC